MSSPRVWIAAALLVCAACPSESRADGERAGAVYTASNQTDDNRVLVFARDSDGELAFAGSVSTGGKGTGAGLGNQGGLLVSPGGRWLFAVNAGSDEVSMFRIGRQGLKLVARVGSGGHRPVSLALHDGLLYVLNGGGSVGGTDNIVGFRVHPLGRLLLIQGSQRPLSEASTGPAQISFSPDGNFLVVTEKATNRILVFPVGDHGRTGPPVVNPSTGETPFGFAFDPDGVLLVSEAFSGATDASALSSYELRHDGTLRVLDASVRTTETAACWVVATGSGRFAYVTNTGSGSVSGYELGEDGALALLDADGVTAPTGAAPIDAAISRNDRFLFELENSMIRGFRIARDGSLAEASSIGGLPAGANGLSVR